MLNIILKNKIKKSWILLSYSFISLTLTVLHPLLDATQQTYHQCHCFFFLCLSLSLFFFLQWTPPQHTKLHHQSFFLLFSLYLACVNRKKYIFRRDFQALYHSTCILWIECWPWHQLTFSPWSANGIGQRTIFHSNFIVKINIHLQHFKNLNIYPRFNCC